MPNDKNEDMIKKYSISLPEEDIQAIKNTPNINNIKGIKFIFLDKNVAITLDLSAFSDSSKNIVKQIVDFLASNYKNKKGIQLFCIIINAKLYQDKNFIIFYNKFIELFSEKEKNQQQEIEKLERKTEYFVSQIDRLTYEKEILSKENNETIASLNEQLLELIACKASLETENERLKNEKKDLDNNFKSIQGQNLNLTTEKTSLTSEIEKLKKERINSDEKFKMIQDEINKLRDENQQFSSENSKLSQQVKELESSKFLISGVNNTLLQGSETHTKDLNVILQETQANLAAQSEKTTTLEEEKAKNLIEIAELNANLATQAQEVEILKRKLANINDRQTNFANKCLGLSLGTGLGLSLSAAGTLSALALTTTLLSPLGPTVVIGLIAGSALLSTTMLIGAIYLAVRKSATKNMRIALGGGVASGVSLSAAGALAGLAFTTALLSPLGPSIVMGLIAGSAMFGIMALLATMASLREKIQPSREDNSVLSPELPLQDNARGSITRQDFSSSHSSSASQSSTRLNSGMVMSLLSSFDCCGLFSSKPNTVDDGGYININHTM